jgi:hypothetical protein
MFLQIFCLTAVRSVLRVAVLRKHKKSFAYSFLNYENDAAKAVWLGSRQPSITMQSSGTNYFYNSSSLESDLEARGFLPIHHFKTVIKVLLVLRPDYANSPRKICIQEWSRAYRRA